MSELGNRSIWLPFVVSILLSIIACPVVAEDDAVMYEGNCCDPDFEVDPNRTVPREYWDYMDGYKYEYSSNCLATWHERSATFLTTDTCPPLSNDKLRADAIKSIKYAQARSNAKNFRNYYEELESGNKQKQQHRQYDIGQSKHDAFYIWNNACLQVKTLEGDFYPEKAIKVYDKIKPMHVGNLWNHAMKTVELYGGVIDCAQYAQVAIDGYTAGIDIRKPEYR